MKERRAAEDVAQVLEGLPSKYKALSLIPGIQHPKKLKPMFLKRHYQEIENLNQTRIQ
jgi:hypothetical protein